MAKPMMNQVGPKGSLLLGSLPELQQDWLGTLRRWQELYGDFVVARLGPRPAVFIFDPHDAEAVLVENYKRFRNLLISPWVIHRDARWFEAPDEFRPERWLAPEGMSIPRCAYLPFGAGPRQCVGNHFAMMEAVITLASIAQRFTLQRDRSNPVIPAPLVSIRPKDGLTVAVTRRAKGGAAQRGGVAR